MPDEAAKKARSRFETALERDYYMTAEEAIKFGLVDQVIQRRPQIEERKDAK